MTPQAASQHPLTVEEYLAGEQDGELRHEYVGGDVYAMTGASDRHGLIVNALAFVLTPAARKRGCQLFSNDMKVRLQQAGEETFYYPDLLLACDPEDRAIYYREKPCLIVEVLSATTERIDRREKLYAYTGGLTSLREYVLVAQDRPHIEIYRRTDTDWIHEIAAEDHVHLNCLDLDLPVDSVYEDLENIPAKPPAP